VLRWLKRERVPELKGEAGHKREAWPYARARQPQSIFLPFPERNNMPFQFIDGAAIDSTSRKLIRSHAAKGKNLGRKLPSRRKQSERQSRTPRLAYLKDQIVEDIQNHALALDEVSPVIIERPIGDGLSSLCFPAELSPASKGLFKKKIRFYLTALGRG